MSSAYPRFGTVAEVVTWAENNGGLQAVRERLAAHRFYDEPRSIGVIKEYIRSEEERLAGSHLRAEAARGERATTAAEESAKAAKLSAEESRLSRWISLGALIVSVITALYTCKGT